MNDCPDDVLSLVQLAWFRKYGNVSPFISVIRFKPTILSVPLAEFAGELIHFLSSLDIYFVVIEHDNILFAGTA